MGRSIYFTDLEIEKLIDYVSDSVELLGEAEGTWEQTAEDMENGLGSAIRKLYKGRRGEKIYASDVYASGKIYDSDSPMSSIDIEVSVIAFPDDTISKMRGETKGTGGLILAGGKSERPIFAYGKVVKLKNGKSRYEWFPKCKLVENSDDIATSEEKASEQTDTIKIRAYPFDAEGNIVSKVTESTAPAGLTEEKFFAKPILTDADLTTAVGA